MDGKSLTPQELKLQQLKEILPEAFAEGKVDWEKLKATLGEDINFTNERYVLNWAGKSEAFKVLQAPTTKTLVPNKEESVNFDETEHIFIEGENLEVLKVLQKSYFGKIKMIYIDPPYNTGNDSFIYPDKFSETKVAYEKRVGDKDEEGYLTKDGMFRKNSKENGQYHSNWLNMMYPRLFLAKNLLKQNGVIFISIDDNEVHNLRMIMNEVFGEENFLASFIWKSRQNVDSRSLNGTSNDHEYILCYSKFLGKIRGKAIDKTKYKNTDSDLRGPWMSSPLDGIATKDKRPNLHYTIINPITNLSYEPSAENGWRFQKSTMNKLIEDNRIIWPKNPKSKPRFKRYLFELNSEYTGFSSILSTVFTTQGTRELRQIMGIETLKFPKPSELIKIFIAQGTSLNNNDIILDFFAGSSTTAHAVMQLNAEDAGRRKCISVQLPELTDEKSEAYKAGFKTIADIGKERIRRAGKKIEEEIFEKIKSKEKETSELKSQLDLDDKEEKTASLKSQIKNLKSQDLGFKVLRLSDSNFKQWQQIKGKDAKALEEQMKLFVDPVSENATVENMVYELLLKSGKDLNSTLRQVDGYVVVNDAELILMLEKATQEIVDAVIKEKPQKVIALDRLFKGNDQLKTNTSLQMKDAEIEFKTI